MPKDIAIVGGGICGLALALNLHSRGISCRVYERVPEVKELGVGITLLPHAMREFTALGVADKLLAAGIENLESCFFNRFGQIIYREQRGKHAGYQYPEVGIHRGKLHLILLQAAHERLGGDMIITGHECTGLDQDDSGVTLHFRETSSGKNLPSVRADAAIACDGINSAIRRKFYPDDKVAFAGINTWRGITRRKPILTGKSYIRVGSILTGKIVIYPIIDDADGEGNQLINWMAEIKQDTHGKNDWNKTGNLEDFFHLYKDWRFPWLDVAAMIKSADQILEYPMVDKDPVDRWTFGRVTLSGDAAHPMYPRGSNGAAQSAIDARTLADLIAKHDDVRTALAEYERARRDVTAKIVRTNRDHPPDFINIKVEELVGDRPFDDLNKYITQDELRALSENYKKIAGFSVSDVTGKSAQELGMVKSLKVLLILIALALGFAPHAGAQTTLRVMVFPGMQNLPLFAAQAKGFFAKRALQVELLLAPNSNELRQGLAEGKHQIAHAGSDNFVALAESGAASIIVMGGDHAANQLFVQPEIASVAELKGKTVIVDAPNTAYALVLYKMLALKGLNRSDYEIRPTGATAGRVQQMLKDKSLAATILNPPFTLTAERGGLKNLGSAKDAIGPYLATAGCVMRDWAKENADTLVRYMQAYIEGLRWSLDPANKAEVTALLAERMKLSPNVAEDTYKLATDMQLAYFAKDAAFDLEGFRNVLKLRAEIEGQWGGNPPAPEKYLDLSYYRRALEGL